MTTDAFTFRITRIPFNEDYQPAEGTRITTNFANLARGASRQENLRNTIRMINNRFNDLAHWDNPAPIATRSSWTSSRWRCTSTAPTAAILSR